MNDHTERDILDLLHRRYSQVSPATRQPRYVLAEHVRNAAGFNANRTADLIVMDTWPGTSHDRLAFHGHEIKCSRGDWLKELRKPEKSEAFRPYCDYWWLVAAGPFIVQDGELPEGWGLIVLRGTKQLRTRVEAEWRGARPMHRTMVAAMLRATVSTAQRRARLDIAAQWREDAFLAQSARS